MAKKKTDQAELPYAPIEASSRDRMREVAESRAPEPECYFFIEENVQLRPGANWRKPAPYQTYEEWYAELEIPELAKGIYANNGPADPIQGDLPINGKVFMISEGQRRILAIRHLLQEGFEEYPNGKPIRMVKVRPNPPGFTELQRLTQNFISQKKMKLKTSQIANGIKHIKDNIKIKDKPITNEQIAELWGDVSRQWVDNMLLVTEMDVDTLKRLDNGEITLTKALGTIRTEKAIVAGKKPKDDSTKVTSVTKPIQEDPPPVINNTYSGIIDPNDNLEDEDYDELDKAAGTSPITKVLGSQAALLAEEQSRTTSAKTPVTKAGKDGLDALPLVDFSREKEEGIMDLTEARKMLDKVTVRFDKITMNKADREDMQGLLHLIGKKIDTAQEVLRKAADQR